MLHHPSHILNLETESKLCSVRPPSPAHVCFPCSLNLLGWVLPLHRPWQVKSKTMEKELFMSLHINSRLIKLLIMMSHLTITEVHRGETLVPSQKGRKQGIRETNACLFIHLPVCKFRRNKEVDVSHARTAHCSHSSLRSLLTTKHQVCSGLQYTQMKTLTYPDFFIASSHVIQFWPMRHKKKSEVGDKGVLREAPIFLLLLSSPLLFSARSMITIPGGTATIL